MPHRTRPMTALLVFTGVNFALASTITPVYDFVCFLAYWERRADNLCQQTLQLMHRILTTRQSARAVLATNDYSPVFEHSVLSGLRPAT